MGELWLATAPERPQFVIKRLARTLLDDEESVALLLKEGRLSTQLRHPNIVQVYEVSEVDGEPFLAMEYVEGVNLRQLLKRFPIQPVEVATYIATEIAAALEYVHEFGEPGGPSMGLVHRDISPANVMLARDGTVKLVDFGIARFPADTIRTREGSFRGKLAYAAPEVLDGAPHEPTADLFGLGAVLWECLVGRSLFAADRDIETFARVMAAQVPPVSQMRPEVPERIEAVCLTLLARLPAERYQRAREAIDALTQLGFNRLEAKQRLAEMVTAIRSVTKGNAPQPSFQPSFKAKRHRAVAAGGLALAACAAILSLSLARPNVRSDLTSGTSHDHPTEPAKLGIARTSSAAEGGTGAIEEQLAETQKTERTIEPKAEETTSSAASLGFTIVSRPKPAFVKTIDGRTLGRTPLLVRDAGVDRVVLTRAGYRSVVVPLRNEGSIQVTLRPQPSRPTPSPNIREGDVVDPF
jgi:serine/threonine protein kinase